VGIWAGVWLMSINSLRMQASYPKISPALAAISPAMTYLLLSKVRRQSRSSRADKSYPCSFPEFLLSRDLLRRNSVMICCTKHTESTPPHKTFLIIIVLTTWRSTPVFFPWMSPWFDNLRLPSLCHLGRDGLETKIYFVWRPYYATRSWAYCK
jgi:hypothetical protein